MTRQGQTPLKSQNSRARAIRSAIRLMLLAAPLSACVLAPPVSLTVSDCRKFVPKDWRAGVPSAPLPRSKATGDWVAFGDAQTGQLDIANLRFAESDEIQQTCEDLLKQAAIDAQPKPWWHFW